LTRWPISYPPDRSLTDAERVKAMARISEDDELSVMGAGCGPAPMPTKAEAESAWRAFYVARMCERGIPREDALACCDASDVDLSRDPVEEADAELEYWGSDEP
jgi:hypothetical protein